MHYNIIVSTLALMAIVSTAELESTSTVEIENKLNLQEATKMTAFEMLASENQNQILSELHAGSGSEVQWGFLKNIINIDTFFAAGAGGKGCKQACSYKDHYKKAAKEKDDKEEKEKARLAKEKADREAKEKAKREKDAADAKAKKEAAAAKSKKEREEAAKRAKEKKRLDDLAKKTAAEKARKLREAKKRAEEAAKKAAEAEKKRKAEEAARLAKIKKAKEEAAKKAAEEAKAAAEKAAKERAEKKAAAEKARKEAEAKRKAALAAAKKRAAELAAKKAAAKAKAAAAAKAKAEAEAKKAAEAKALAEKKAAEEKAKKEAEEKAKLAAAKAKAELEAAMKAKKEAEIAAAKKAAEEAAAKAKAAAEKAAAAKKAQEAAAAKAKAQAEAARKAQIMAQRKAKAELRKKTQIFWTSSRRKFANELVKDASNQRFYKRQLFYVSMKRSYPRYGANQYTTWTNAFWAWNMRSAMNQFRYRTRNYMANQHFEAGLVHYQSGNMMVSTEAFSDDFSFSKKDEKDKDETYQDSGSRRMIGEGVRRGFIRIPSKWTRGSYGYLQFKGGKASWVALGSNFRRAWGKFQQIRRQKVDSVFLRPNGRIYTYSGARNRWGVYYMALEGIGAWFHDHKRNLAPMMDEKSCGIYTYAQWKQRMAGSSKFVDALKFSGNNQRLFRVSPFWIQYIWTGNNRAGYIGQAQYFRAWNLGYAINRFKSYARANLRRGYKIDYILSYGWHPTRQVVCASKPMNSPSIKVLLGWMLRVNRLRTPTAPSLDKQFTLITQNRDKMSEKPDVKYFAGDKYREALRASSQAYSKGRRRVAVVLVRGDGQILRSYSINDSRRTLYRYQNLAYKLLAENAQTLGEHKEFQMSEKALGMYTRREWNIEWRRVMQYKYAYRRRMNAFRRQVYAERAKLMKQSRNILLDKVYYFSLTMQYSVYNQFRRDHQPRGHQNQWIRTNQFQYPLLRFGHMIGYRTNWFMRDRNQRVGPEHSLIGNNRILWTTATKDKKVDRATTIGVAMATGVFKYQNAPKNGMFVIGTVDGKVKPTQCKNIGQCKRMYYAYYRSGVTNVPYGVIQGNRIILRRGTNYYSSWNGFRDGSAYYNMFGQMLMMVDKKMATAGSVFNFKSFGFKTQRLLKKRYYFQAVWNYDNGARQAKQGAGCACIRFRGRPADCRNQHNYQGRKTPWCYVRRGCRQYVGGISRLDRRTPWGNCDSRASKRVYPRCRSKLDFSRKACIAALQKAGYKPGGKGYRLDGNWSIKGCFAYKSGKFKGYGYYGLVRGREITRRRQMNNIHASMVRLEGFPKCGSGGGTKAVRKGCFADGGSGDRGRKSGSRRAIPKFISSGKGCGQAAVDRCKSEAEAKGWNVFGIQWPQGRCQCFIGNSERQAKQWGRSRRCNNKGEGGPWANEVYVIESAAPTTYTRQSPWMLTNNWEYSMKWYNNPRQAWNRPTRNQKPKASSYFIWLGKDYYQLVTQKGSRSWHEKAQMTGRIMWGRYVDPECQRAMRVGGNQLFGIWQSTPQGEWRSAIYRNSNRSRNYWQWRKQMQRQRTQGLLFYPTGPRNRRRYRMWTAVSYIKAQREWNYYLLGKFIITKCPNRYVKAKGSMAELGLRTY